MCQFVKLLFFKGRGSGSFFGGNLIGKMGIRESFRIMGLVAISAGFLYLVLNFFWLRYTEISEEKTEEDIGKY